MAFATTTGLALSGSLPAQAASVTADQQRDFLARVVPAAQAAQRATGVPASVSIAQAIEETKWGSTAPAQNANNYFQTACSARFTPGQFAALAEEQVGKPYVLGAEASVTDPNPPKFDCSELVEWLFGRSGTYITDLAASQYNVTKPVASGSSPKVGDLVFLRNNPARSNGIGHVAVLTKKLDNGDWRIIEAKGRAYGVVRSTLSYWKTRPYYAGLRRYAKLVFGDGGGAVPSAASTYQAGCVTIGDTRYAKFASVSDSFRAHAAAVLNDEVYRAARAVLSDVPSYVAAIAAAERPKDPAGYAATLTGLIADHDLRDYDVVPFTLVLESGDSSPKVTAVQYLLTAAGHQAAPTGKYDAETVAAVKKFQRARKLTVDGEAGPKTLAALAPRLAAGANGGPVSALHSLLTANGYPVDEAARFAETTTSSVKAFQESAGRRATGTVDASTWAALFMTLDPATPPTITGTAKVGATLKGATAKWGPGSVRLAYQWYRGETPIAGATQSSHKVGLADAGSPLRLVITGTKPAHTPTRRSSAPTATVPLLTLKTTPKPVVTGTAKVGQVLTANPGIWAPAGVQFGYQWFRGSAAIPGATEATYRVQVADAGAKLKVAVTGSSLGYASVVMTSATTAAVPNTITAVKPRIEGEPQVGRTLTAQTGSWEPAQVAFTYQWYRGEAPVAGATGRTYLVSAADLGQPIRVKVTGKLAGHTTAADTSDSTAAVVEGQLTNTGAKISGTRVVGRTLTAVGGNWGPGRVALSYQWYRGDGPIKGADHPTYVLKSADRGKTISVVITGSKAGFAKVSEKASAKVR